MKTDELNPVKNPSEEDYDKTFNDIVSSPENTALADQGRVLAEEIEAETARAGGEDTLGGREQAADNVAQQTDDNDGSNFYNPTSSPAAPAKGGLSGLRNRLDGLTARKKLLWGIAGVGGTGLIIVIAVMVFLLALGFSLQQAAVVAENYASYRFNRVSNALTMRVIDGDAFLKSGNGLTTAVRPSGLRTQLQGFDIERVLNNLEQSGKLTYIRDGSVVTGVKIGDAEVSLERGSSATKRVAALKEVNALLGDEFPELTVKKSFIGKTGQGIFERVRLDRVRWSEKVLAKIKNTVSPKEALGADQAEQLEKVRGSPETTGNTDAKIDAAQDAADEEIPKAAQDGDFDPAASAVDSQIDAMEGSERILSSNAGNAATQTIGSAVEGLSTVAAYTLCTINGIVEASDQTTLQNNDASIRQAGQLSSAASQFRAGKTNPEAVGAQREMLGEFNQTAAYQRATYNPDWQDYEPLPAIDQPQPKTDGGWFGTFKTISEVTNGVWERTTNPTGLLPNPTFSTFCNFINNPAGGLIYGVASGLVEQFVVNTITGGSGAIPTEAGEQAIRAATDEAVEAGTSSAVKAVIKEQLTTRLNTAIERREGDSILKAVGRKLFKSTVNPKNVAVAGSVFGLSYMLVKMANGSGGYTYTGTSSNQHFGQAAAGWDVMANDFNRQKTRGIPLSDDEVTTYSRQQFSDYQADQKKKPLYARLFNLKDPYSMATRVAVGTPTTSTGAKKLALSAVNPLSLLDVSRNPATNFVRTAMVDQNAAWASAADVEALTDNVQQWGLTSEELNLVLTNDTYSLQSIVEWAETTDGSAVISKLDSKYGECYSAENEMSNILLDDRLNQLCLHTLPDENKTNGNIFKWRLYGAYELEATDLVDLQTITEDSGPATASATPTAGDPLAADSSSTPCAAGTEDLGVRDDAYNDGNRIKIRLCAVTSIAGPGNGNESNAQVAQETGKGNIPYAMVSSVVSDAWQKLGAAAKAAGISLSAGSSWRTMAHQQRLCADDDKCPGGDYNDVAKPGTSNHQAGAAIDIAEIYQAVDGPASGRDCANPQTANVATYTWMKANAATFGIKQYANEAWHWGPLEKC